VKAHLAVLLAFTAIATGLLASACGSSGHEEHARSLYNAYRAAEDSRTDAEEELRLAFADISSAAQKLDREGVLAAAKRGQDAVQKIDDLIAAELEAAAGLAEIESTAAHAKKLSEGLELSRQASPSSPRSSKSPSTIPSSTRGSRRSTTSRSSRPTSPSRASSQSGARSRARARPRLEPRLDQALTTPTTTTG
jgi:hypothetical protein